ncbi:hypothetical protein MRX96_044786 [Rhipicephalus microplus]
MCLQADRKVRVQRRSPIWESKTSVICALVANIQEKKLQTLRLSLDTFVWLPLLTLIVQLVAAAHIGVGSRDSEAYQGSGPGHHRAQDLSSLRTSQCVWVRPGQAKATVLSPARRPRSYVVETEQGGVLQRSRRHLVPFAPPAPRVEPPPSEEQEPQRTLPLLEPQRTTTVQPPDSLGLPPADSDRTDGVTRTRSGRRVVPPNRLNL